MPEDKQVIILHGTDDYAIQESEKQLIAGMGAGTTPEMNITRLDGVSLVMEDLHTAANAAPFLSDRRLVILRNFSAFSPRSPLDEGFRTFLEKMPVTTTLVLVTNGSLFKQAGNGSGKDKKEHWILKWASGAGKTCLVEFHALSDLKALPAWIIQETRKQGGSITGDAAQLLAGHVGGNKHQAALEIDKMLNYVNFEKVIDRQDVEAVSLVSAQGKIFDLVDAMGNRDAHKAQNMLAVLLQNENPLSLWGMVIRQFRLLLQTREILDAGGNPQQVEKILHVHSFVAGKISMQARRWSMTELKSIHHRLLELEEGIKTGKYPPSLPLETLVVELGG